MHKELVTVYNSIKDLATTIIGSTSEERTISEIGISSGYYSFPPLNKYDLASLASKLLLKLDEYKIETLTDDNIKSLRAIPQRIEVFKSQSLSYMFNANYQYNSGNAYIALIDWMTATIEPLFSWQVLNENKLLPKELVRKLRAIQTELEELAPQKEELREQITLIKEATEAAETLPTDLKSLKEARTKVDKIHTESAESFGKISSYLKQAFDSADSIHSKKTEADKLVEQCYESYKITTTIGLAAAFDARAKKLSDTLIWWVVGLLASLIAGGIIGAFRFNALAESLKNPNPHWGVLWMEFILSIVGLAAPIWFAWLATKQISQRFRLAEDYAFKASVAKAYEGYRREAARIDPVLEARLFSSALLRLEEAPLRLIESDNHGSPWHELFSSKPFQEALDNIPDLKNKFIELAKDGIGVLKRKTVLKKINAEENDIETDTTK